MLTARDWAPSMYVQKSDVTFRGETAGGSPPAPTGAGWAIDCARSAQSAHASLRTLKTPLVRMDVSNPPAPSYGRPPPPWRLLVLSNRLASHCSFLSSLCTSVGRCWPLIRLNLLPFPNAHSFNSTRCLLRRSEDYRKRKVNVQGREACHKTEVQNMDSKKYLQTMKSRLRSTLVPWTRTFQFRRAKASWPCPRMTDAPVPQ